MQIKTEARLRSDQNLGNRLAFHYLLKVWSDADGDLEIPGAVAIEGPGGLNAMIGFAQSHAFNPAGFVLTALKK